MDVGKKMAHTAEAVRGSAKKALGRVTGNRRTQAEGRGAKAKGNAKQSGSKIRDAFRH
ncbi:MULTISPECIES: CsbD family protein [Streptomyces violaceusniger group]|uniref:CsbD-like domain-containing protein n=2 Tax=Streptomyces javensis TaxID=114698 RepID=A0ABP4I0I9_9ACTN|nr:CsbD family protein [Streptomyces javensis]MBI0315811.1 CsbD family protein [Streptomyces javensis]